MGRRVDGDEEGGDGGGDHAGAEAGGGGEGRVESDNAGIETSEACCAGEGWVTGCDVLDEDRSTMAAQGVSRTPIVEATLVGSRGSMGRRVMGGEAQCPVVAEQGSASTTMARHPMQMLTLGWRVW